MAGTLVLKLSYFYVMWNFPKHSTYCVSLDFLISLSALALQLEDLHSHTSISTYQQSIILSSP